MLAVLKRNKPFTCPNGIFINRKTKCISETRCRIQTLQDFGLYSLPCGCQRQALSEVVDVPWPSTRSQPSNGSKKHRCLLVDFWYWNEVIYCRSDNPATGIRAPPAASASLRPHRHGPYSVRTQTDSDIPCRPAPLPSARWPAPSHACCRASR